MAPAQIPLVREGPDQVSLWAGRAAFLQRPSTARSPHETSLDDDHGRRPAGRVQAAITNFDLTRPDPKLRDLLPAKIAINVTREVIGKEPYLLRVGSMAQLLDAQSGKLLVRVMDARESPDTTHKDSPITAEEMEKMIDQWAASRAKQLADNLGR